MNEIHILKNEEDTIILHNNVLSDESINLINNKYKINNFTKLIKQYCCTNDSFALLTENNEVISFGKVKIFKILNKLEKIVSNHHNFCGITLDDKIIFWGNTSKKITLPYKINKNLCEIHPLSNGFLIYDTPNIYLYGNSSMTKIIKNVEWLVDLNGKVKVFKKHNEINCIEKDINKKHIINTSTTNSQLNLLKSLIINNLINNKNRLLEILDHCIKNNIEMSNMIN